MICTGRTAMLAILLAGISRAAQTSVPSPRIGIVHVQTALLKTRDGRAAAAELQRKAGSREQGLKKLQSDIAALREELKKSSVIGSQSRKDTLAQEIEHKTKLFNRELEDLQTELDQEQSRVLNDLGTRMLNIIRKFATSAGYGLVIDTSASQNPVLFASEALDVSGEVVRMFDESSAAPLPAGAPTQPRK
jgi:outer membrane protein